jgi:glycosyltransferase involved in cell wall biosynthesis
MPTITAAIITLNEERNILRCINSLKDCVDEIVVLDSFSTDSTVAICLENNVRVIQREWLGYSQAKNYLNSHITTELIFSVDADEALRSTESPIIVASGFGILVGFQMLKLGFLHDWKQFGMVKLSMKNYAYLRIPLLFL